jgi:hypothetical protein
LKSHNAALAFVAPALIAEALTASGDYCFGSYYEHRKAEVKPPPSERSSRQNKINIIHVVMNYANRMGTIEGRGFGAVSRAGGRLGGAPAAV